MSLVSAFAVVAQQILIERDNVPSIIRMIDLFTATPDIPRLPDGSLPPIQMQLFIYLRFTPDDEEVHHVGFVLQRPDGSETTQPIFAAPASRNVIPEGDRGINGVVPLGVNPTQFGKHQIFVLVDEVRVARAAFFILQSPLPPSEARAN